MNITCALLVLLASMYVRSRPLDFSIFPSSLLIATLFRLALNVSATRLVLLHGYAGKVIERVRPLRRRRLGDRRPRDLPRSSRDPVHRHHERCRTRRRGRRPLHPRRDARQADGDRRRPERRASSTRTRPASAAAEVADEADFYGAMDGASKFVKGDAIAAIVIALINLIGGFAVGDPAAAPVASARRCQTYSLLTVGDGLVAQIPALLHLAVVRPDRHPRRPTTTTWAPTVSHQFSRTSGRCSSPAGPRSCCSRSCPACRSCRSSRRRRACSSRRQPAAASADEDAGRGRGAPPSPAPVSPPDSPEALAERDARRAARARARVRPHRPRRPAAAATCSTACARCAASSRSSSASSSRSCAPATTSTCRTSTYAITRQRRRASAAAKAPPGTVLVLGDDLERRCPARRPREPVFGLPASGCRSSSATRPSCPARPSSTASSVITTHLAEVVRRNAGRLLGRQDVQAARRRSSSTATRSWSTSSTPAHAHTWARSSACCTRCSTRASSIRDLVRIFEALSLARQGQQRPRPARRGRPRRARPGDLAGHAVDGTAARPHARPAAQQSLLESLRPGDGGTHLAARRRPAERLTVRARPDGRAGRAAGHPPGARLLALRSGRAAPTRTYIASPTACAVVRRSDRTAAHRDDRSG